MRSFRIPIILSLLAHVLFIGLFAFLMNDMRSSRIQADNLTVFITPSETEPPLIEEEETGAPESAGILLPASTIPVEEKKPLRPDATPPSKTDDPTEKAWTSFLKEGEARVTLLRQETDKDSVTEKQNAFSEITMRPFRIGKPQFGLQDPVAEDLLKRNVGAKQFLLNLTPVAEIEKKTVRPTSLDFIPTHTQLACLSRLMDEDSLSDTELYPLLGETGNTTFENFRKEMDLLTEKGLVVREKVSPVQTFSFFGFPIEMSSKNSRNPEFRYQPHVKRKTVCTFLEARLYAVKEQLRENPSDSVRIQEQLDSLSEKLALIRPVSK